jgi:two-component system osmolarity sensor histidine kinase EnvZ
LAFRRGRGLAKVYNMFFTWLKRYMPRGIYGRAALILLLPVVILQLVVTVIFAQRNYEGVTTQMTTTVLREVALVLNVAAEAPSAEAIAPLVRQRLSPLMIQVAPVMPDDLKTQNELSWYDYSGRVMIQLFQDRLKGFQTLDLTEPSLVHLVTDTDNGPIRISFDRRRISASNPHQLFVYTFTFGFLMTLISFVYLRNQLRPIKRLARAAEAFGRGRHVPYSPAGAVELRAAGSAFLDMRTRIERHIEQRTLMLSGVSHDLRTPLTRMRLGLSMLDDEEAGPLLQDVDDMQRMLDEFLNFAKGAAEGEFEKLDPHVLLKDAVAKAQQAGRNVTLLPREGDGAGTIRLRKVAILRAVDNLISNAVRYGTKAEVSILLTEKTLRIRVEDDGPGIPEERRQEAVRPFSRLDPARNQNKGGSVGLGLAITTDIARAHGGVLRLGVSDRLGGLRADIVIAR